MLVLLLNRNCSRQTRTVVTFLIKSAVKVRNHVFMTSPFQATKLHITVRRGFKGCLQIPRVGRCGEREIAWLEIEIVRSVVAGGERGVRGDIYRTYKVPPSLFTLSSQSHHRPDSRVLSVVVTPQSPQSLACYIEI